MISRVAGTLMAKELDRVEIMTSGGVGYDISVPLSVFEMPGRVGDLAPHFGVDAGPLGRHDPMWQPRLSSN